MSVYVNPRYERTVDTADLLRLPQNLSALPGTGGRLPGRVTSWQWDPPWHEGPGLMVRQYAHGGVCGRLLGMLFWGRRRMLEEFHTSLAAQRAGVPTARPVALRIERACGPLVRAHYVSERIPEAVDLLRLAREAGGGPAPTGPQRRRLAAAVADAVARMHEAGILHADLNLKNVLVRRAFDEPEGFLVDFDKARRASALALPRRMANLRRLDRSVLKWEASRRLITPRDRLRVLRCYLARCPQWRRQWGRIAGAHASRHLRHRPFREPERGDGRR
ncbi:MAG: lipopolysaccharide kinase InaA family protein [Planctomycetota bacterium]